MRAKDRVIGWAFMAAWALLAYIPAIIGIVIFQYIGPSSYAPATDNFAIEAVASVWGIGSVAWANQIIRTGRRFCTVQGPDRAEFERQLWKLK